jgi:hypothetical protein
VYFFIFFSFPVLVLKQTGKRFLHAFRACRKGKREISHYHVPGLASAFSHFRGLAAAMLDGLARSRDPRFSSCAVLLNFQGTIPVCYTADRLRVPWFGSISVVSII